MAFGFSFGPRPLPTMPTMPTVVAPPAAVVVDAPTKSLPSASQDQQPTKSLPTPPARVTTPEAGRGFPVSTMPVRSVPEEPPLIRTTMPVPPPPGTPGPLIWRDSTPPPWSIAPRPAEPPCGPDYFPIRVGGQCVPRPGPEAIYRPPPSSQPSSFPVVGAPVSAGTQPSWAPLPAQQAILATASGASSSPVSGVASAAAPAPSGLGPLLAGAGAGFLVGGPPGAAIGAVAAHFLTRKKEATMPATPTSQFAHFSHPAFGEYAFGSWFSKAVKTVTHAASSVVSTVGAVGRAVDPTSSRSIFAGIPMVGGMITNLSRQAIATSAAGLTGGASVLLAQKGVLPKSTFGLKTTTQGFLTGATIGAGILAGGSIGAIASGVIKSGAAAGQPVPQPAQAVPVQEPVPPPVTTVTPLAQPAPAGTNLGAILAGAGAGFLLGGPIGAGIGGIAGALVKPKMPAAPVYGLSGYGAAADAVIRMRQYRRG